jgi:hypothetical protein
MVDAKQNAGAGAAGAGPGGSAGAATTALLLLLLLLRAVVVVVVVVKVFVVALFPGRTAATIGAQSHTTRAEPINPMMAAVLRARGARGALFQ